MIIHCLFLSVIGTVFSEKCGQGVLQLSNQCAIVKQTGNGIGYFAADLECRALGGQLLSIHNELANTAIAEYATGVNDTNHFYIGGVSHRSGVWEWRDGTEMDYTNWAKGQPDESGGCITIHLENYQWYATDCERAIPSVCGIPFSSESNSTPTKPTTITTTTTSVPSCPAKWKEFEQNCYAVFGMKEKLNYDGGRGICKGYGGDLASIHSESENAVITELAYSRSEDFNYPYIGLYWNGTFSWIDGTPFTLDRTTWLPTVTYDLNYDFEPSGHWRSVLTFKRKFNSAFACKAALNSVKVPTPGST